MSNACVCMCMCVCVYVCVTTAGVVSTVAGSTVSGYVDGVGTVAKFNGPNGISVDSTGNVWVADRSNHMIRQINAAGEVHACMHTQIYSMWHLCVGCVSACGCSCGSCGSSAVVELVLVAAVVLQYARMSIFVSICL